jgi:hypothetical protein
MGYLYEACDQISDFWTRQIPSSCLSTLLIFLHIEHICSFFITFFSASIDGRNLIFGHKLHVGDEKLAYIFNVYKNQQIRQTGSRNLMCPKTLPTIWGTYMKLVTKYQISAINSCWEKCDEKCAYMFNVYKNQLRSQASYRYPISWEAFLDPLDSYFLFADFVDFYTHLTYITFVYAHFASHFSKQLLMTGIWYLVTSFI